MSQTPLPATPNPPPRRPVAQLATGFLQEWVFDKKVPSGIGFARALGTGLLMLLLVQAVTGMMLGLLYSPSPDHAYDSIRYIDEDVLGGRFLRGLHHYNASAIVVLIVAHMTRVFFTAAYKHPRRSLWVTGLLLLLVVLGFGFTGYLLPWDQKGYWATAVGFEIAETVPIVGPLSADVMRGGPEVGAPTLTRMFGLHVLVLPAVLAGLVAVHLFLVHRLGITPPGARVGEPEVKSAPFFPDHVLREIVLGAVALGLVALASLIFGPPLEAPASRAAAGYDPRPDWYFLWLFQLLHELESQPTYIGTVVVPGGVFMALFLLPFADINRSRKPLRRPLVLLLGVGFLAGLGWLTVRGFANPGSKTKPPERVLVAPDDYQAPPSPPFQAPRGLPPDPLALAPEVQTALARIKLYECLYCHTLDGRGDDSGTEGPRMEDVAVDRNAEWLHALLLDPSSVYPDTDMPAAADLDMSEQDRQLLVSFLLSLAAGEVELAGTRWFEIEAQESEPEAVPDPAPEGDGQNPPLNRKPLAELGPDLLQTYECLYCHTLDGEGDEMGEGAPELATAAEEHPRQWLDELLLDPKSKNPDTDMPAAEDLDMTEADRKGLVDYLLLRAGKR